MVGLLLDLPDFTGPMRRIASSAEMMAGLKPGEGDTIGEEDAAGQPQKHDAMKEVPDRNAMDIAPPQGAAEIARARHGA